LEAVLDKAVQLEDGKKLTRYVKSFSKFMELTIFFNEIPFLILAALQVFFLCFRGIDLESMSIAHRDALLLFRTLCKVGVKFKILCMLDANQYQCPNSCVLI
jgi:hypothetical protein